MCALRTPLLTLWVSLPCHVRDKPFSLGRDWWLVDLSVPLTYDHVRAWVNQGLLPGKKTPTVSLDQNHRVLAPKILHSSESPGKLRITRGKQNQNWIAACLCSGCCKNQKSISCWSWGCFSSVQSSPQAILFNFAISRSAFSFQGYSPGI